MGWSIRWQRVGGGFDLEKVDHQRGVRVPLLLRDQATIHSPIGAEVDQIVPRKQTVPPPHPQMVCKGEGRVWDSLEKRSRQTILIVCLTLSPLIPRLIDQDRLTRDYWSDLYGWPLHSNAANGDHGKSDYPLAHQLHERFPRFDALGHQGHAA